MALTPEDLAAISKIMEGTEQRLEGKIQSAVETAKQEILEGVGELFEKTWKLIDENKKELTERVTALEEQAHSHKN